MDILSVIDHAYVNKR